MANLDASLSASSRLNMDSISTIPRSGALRLAHSLLDGFDKQSGEELLVALAVAFAAAAERYSGGAEALHTLGDRILREAAPYDRKGNAERDSLRDYVALKVRTDPRI